ncbi:hypothetical protein [Lichenibacterium dinghuense]|uniref:hypothetical protein n=1 Tax=Lichenibacterium dinghuense TaxID=2895977 RepID=UPI001F160750|nr:hypothetical protein [Lichenibacterium sp. 6Y81]
MGDLIFDGDDLRGLFGTMLEALAETRRTGQRPAIVVNGKRIAPHDLVKVGRMMPDVPLTAEDQARSPFQKRQKSYFWAGYNIAHRINGILADERAQHTAAATLARMTEEKASVQTVDRSKPADGVSLAPNDIAGGRASSKPVVLKRKTVEQRIQELLNHASAINDRGKLRGSDRDNMSRLIDGLRSLSREWHSRPIDGSESTLDDVLKADPSRADRDIARQMKCSPTTVGRARARLRLVAEVRSVQRGGQMISMKRRGAVVE